MEGSVDGSGFGLPGGTEDGDAGLSGINDSEGSNRTFLSADFLTTGFFEFALAFKEWKTVLVVLLRFQL